MCEQMFYKWYKHFQDGPESAKVDGSAGRPSVSMADEKVEQVKEKVINYCQITVTKVTEEVGISYDSYKLFSSMFWSLDECHLNFF